MFMASVLSFPLPKPSTPCVIAKASSASVTSSPSAAAAAAAAENGGSSLDQKFGRKGIKFLESPGDVPTVELTVRNGSSVKVHIPTAHVTSYRPKVYWKDDGFEEVLYTIPKGSSSSAKGGIGLVFNQLSEPNSKGSLLNTSDWTVTDVDTDSLDAVQIELSSTSGTLELTYVITLYQLSVATAVMVKNNGSKAVNLAGAILTHFMMKRRRGAGVEGLRSSSYCSLPPLSSQYEILSPSEAMKTEEPGWFSFGWEPEKKSGEWSIQEDRFTVMKHKMSRVYAAPPADRLKDFYNTAPSKYEILDKGRELFFRVIRVGFDDIYLSGPGSLSEKYGKGYFICTGPASMLVPIIVNPGEEWMGAQVIEHDNL